MNLHTKSTTGIKNFKINSTRVCMGNYGINTLLGYNIVLIQINFSLVVVL